MKEEDPRKAVEAVMELLASEKPISSKDIQGTTRISTNELQRMKDSITKFERDAAARREELEERLKMKETSKEMVSTWPNTLAGLHQQKLSLRKEKERLAEEARREIDLEEAKFQAEKRKQLLEEARKLQYWQTDRVKGFHGAVLMSEVLREREAQLKFQNQKAEEFRNREDVEFQRMQQAVREAEIEEAKKAMARKKEVLDNQTFLLAQMDVNYNDKVRNVEANKQYGEYIWSDVQDFLQMKAEEKEDRKKAKQQLLKDNLNHLSNREEHRRQIREMEREELENMSKFAKAKQKMSRLTKEKQNELFQIKQKAKEDNAKKLDEKYQKISTEKMNDEEERLTNAISEQEKRLAEEEAKKEAERQKAIKEKNEHLHKTMMEKAAAEAAAKEEERELIALRNEADAIFLENEKEKQKITGEENKMVNKYRQHQVEMKTEKRKMRREEAVAIDKMHEERMIKDEQEFQDYAKKTMEEKAAIGCPIFPLEKVALAGSGGGRGPIFEGKGHVRPSYMTADSQGTQLPCNGRQDTEYVKETVNGKARTKQRLGFVWN